MPWYLWIFFIPTMLWVFGYFFFIIIGLMDINGDGPLEDNRRKLRQQQLEEDERQMKEFIDSL